MSTDQLITAILKSDDDAVLHAYNEHDGSFEISAELDVEKFGMTRDETTTTPILAVPTFAHVPVRIFRVMCAAHALFSFCGMLMAYFCYYMLKYQGDASVVLFATIASSVCVAVFYVAAALSDWFFIALVPSFIVWLGALSAVTSGIVPIQCACMCFAQCIALYTYTLDNPKELVRLDASLYTLVASMLVLLSGVYGFVVQRAWLSPLVLCAFAVGNACYLLMVQMSRLDRYSLSGADLRRAIFNIYLDPTTGALRYRLNFCKNCSEENNDG